MRYAGGGTSAKVRPSLCRYCLAGVSLPDCRSTSIVPAPGASFDETLVRAGGNRQLLVRLCDIFASEAPKSIAGIADALAAKAAAALEVAAHTLKGTLAFFGAHHAKDLAYELEQAARANDFQRADQTFAMLERVLPIVLQTLKSWTPPVDRD
jgi:HPt (histidine-containing phosphotransfer) domain-containing protein